MSRERFVIAWACVLLGLGAAAAGQQKSSPPREMSTILYGAAYYPEYMPYDRLDTDVELMQKAGITVVRVGESTWSSWEPRDGDFQSAWMQRVLDRLHRAGIKVILGTPTYSIPTWLHRKHPDIVVTHNTTASPLWDPHAPSYPSSQPPGYYGPRQNYDFLNPHFRKHAERIVRQIAGRFKNHPAVIGYQIDNETFPTAYRRRTRRPPSSSASNKSTEHPRRSTNCGGSCTGDNWFRHGRTSPRATASSTRDTNSSGRISSTTS